LDPSFNVALTIGGKRRTFFFTPQANAIFSFFYVPQYTAEPGFFGSMTTTGDNCFGVLLRVGNLYQCGIGPLGFYQPNGYVYTDPYGRVYTMGTDGTLQSLRDLNGNTLTVTAAGISSTNGLNVPFVRDTSGRITRITDTLGHQYNYTYDASGNLASVAYPGPPAHDHNTGRQDRDKNV
jgi:YD repeat-containing protein